MIGNYSNKQLSEKELKVLNHYLQTGNLKEELAAASKLLKALKIATKYLGLQREMLDGLEAPVIVITGHPQASGRGVVDISAQVQAPVAGQLEGPGMSVEIALGRDDQAVVLKASGTDGRGDNDEA